MKAIVIMRLDRSDLLKGYQNLPLSEVGLTHFKPDAQTAIKKSPGTAVFYNNRDGKYQLSKVISC